MNWDTMLITGWDSMGVFEPLMDGTDINDCVRNPNEENYEVAAVGDDFGFVRLHNYPAIDPNKRAVYSGHSSQVANLDWTGDYYGRMAEGGWRDDKRRSGRRRCGEYLISCGGEDFAIFQWKFKSNKIRPRKKTQTMADEIDEKRDDAWND